jgi:hypothetical protein
MNLETIRAQIRSASPRNISLASEQEHEALHRALEQSDGF